MTILTKPFNFLPNTTIASSEVDSDFDTLYTDYNGHITNANIDPAAAIAWSKMAGTIPQNLSFGAGLGFNNGLTITGGNLVAQVPFLWVREEQANGTNGGSSLTGNNVRILNTVKSNTITGASLAGNQITLPAGTYYVNASSPAYASDGSARQHKLRFYNVTDASVAIVGENEAYYNYNSSRSRGTGTITIAGAKAFSLYDYISLAFATTGLGIAVSSGDVEVYSDVQITKLA